MSSNGFKIVDKPEIVACGSKWKELLNALNSLPVGKAISIPRMNRNDYASLIFVAKYHNIKISTRRIGEEHFVWLKEPVNAAR